MQTLEKVKYFVAPTSEFPQEGGSCAKVGNHQIAIFYFHSRNEWYACENACPHSGDMVLSRGLLGDSNAEPKVSCPLHKRNFSLKSGECLSGDSFKVKTYPVIVEDGKVFLEINSSMLEIVES